MGSNDVIARETITDALGSYCAVSPSPDSPAMQLDEERVRLDALETWAFTREEAHAAQKTAVTFLVEEVLDSSILDTQQNGTVDDWYAATPYRFVDFIPTDGVVLHDRLPPLARDGAPRASEIRVTVTRVTAQGGKAGPRSLLVVLEADASYRAQDAASAVEAHVDYQLSFTPDGGIIGYSYRYDIAD
ncbi:hypothetical protein FVA74_04295 [Salinibacterium sp. dk2585]|uniref:hypothetical protein n=1 Tax=unclassified Salinibacterium TaxID=2632331 RepID=UPI0011C253D1|nr:MULTISPECIES: hypothetical protein [unclassified Salinibacterium]QEE60887.1 hypothetical protein FVA74_04295 [Salinibacterium sp. dk2585]TXK55958.1 hypothetical protein FVP63_04440 [Salinibacterium sp. dk5596]